MKIVIDIPNFAWIEDIKDFKSAVKEYDKGSAFDYAIRESLLLGTPLPEHHGRLIDSKVLGNYFWDNRSKLFEYKDLQIVIDNAPTIIEGSDTECQE